MIDLLLNVLWKTVGCFLVKFIYPWHVQRYRPRKFYCHTNKFCDKASKDKLIKTKKVPISFKTNQNKNGQVQKGENLEKFKFEVYYSVHILGNSIW